MDRSCFHATRPAFRFVLLALTSALTFGSYYSFDLPSVLEKDYFENVMELDLSGKQYGLLFSVYAWSNAVMVLGAGWLVDKLGNKIGVLLFSSLCLIGQTMFTLGCWYKLYPVMLIGRIIFGTGGGSITIVQNRLTAFWFKDKELAFAFGITLSFSRLGSVLNFLLTTDIANRYGYIAVLWGGTALCGFGVACACVVAALDGYGLRQLNISEEKLETSKKLRPSDIKKLNARFWIISFLIMFVYNGIFPFVAVASSFIQDKYGYEQDHASQIAGAVYYVSLIMSPLFGILIDFVGKRGYIISGNALLTIPVFALLAFTKVPPLLPILWLGLTYSLAASSLWPSIPLLVPEAVIGTCMALATSTQMIGIGISNLIIGAIHVKGVSNVNTIRDWDYAIIYLLANTLLSLVLSVFLNIQDRKHDRTLNMSKKEKKEVLQAARWDAFDSVSNQFQDDDEQEPLIRHRAIN